MFTWQLWQCGDWWGNLFLSFPSRGLNHKALQTTLGGTSMLHCAAMQLFIWKWLCQPSVLFLEATVCTAGYAGLRLDVEYCLVNHRELQYHRRSRFCLEPAWPDSILIPASSDKSIMLNRTPVTHVMGDYQSWFLRRFSYLSADIFSFWCENDPNWTDPQTAL